VYFKSVIWLHTGYILITPFSFEGLIMTDIARILLIDDDKNIRQTLSIVLQEEGYFVDTAENGKEAVEKSYANFYNLAIVDWRLPDVDGTILITQLKETTPKMAKIMLTGYPSMNNAIEAVNQHADAFLVKPVAVEELLKKIRELLILQEENKEFAETKIVSFIETRTQQILQEDDMQSGK
jgi:DNA-binding NtrC family response regulator